jgi:CBS domain-containing protein
MKVSEAMHSGCEWVSPQTSLAKIAEIMRAQDIGAVPVGENDRLIGMVTDRDIVTRGLAGKKDFAKLTARDVMTEGVVWCGDQIDLGEAITMMERKKIRRLPVVNKDKRMVGMLALGDISHSRAGDLSARLMPAVSAHH